MNDIEQRRALESVAAARVKLEAEEEDTRNLLRAAMKRRDLARDDGKAEECRRYDSLVKKYQDAMLQLRKKHDELNTKYTRIMTRSEAK